jgi:hypothetical protein
MFAEEFPDMPELKLKVLKDKMTNTKRQAWRAWAEARYTHKTGAPTTLEEYQEAIDEEQATAVMPTFLKYLECFWDKADWAVESHCGEYSFLLCQRDGLCSISLSILAAAPQLTPPLELTHAALLVAAANTAPATAAASVCVLPCCSQMKRWGTRMRKVVTMQMRERMQQQKKKTQMRGRQRRQMRGEQQPRKAASQMGMGLISQAAQMTVRKAAPQVIVTATVTAGMLLMGVTAAQSGTVRMSVRRTRSRRR